ncbi:TPA: hypothetical protein P0E24_003223 [Vibrio campbellii]|nr:hypothetical protein [Vibrio campbellii]
MKKITISIIILLVLTPLVFPLLIKAYLAYVPGEMIGGIDGWLGFLGGYLGGFLAFLSAYFIFKNDRDVRERTWLNIYSDSGTMDDVASSLVFDAKGGKTCFDMSQRFFTSVGVYPITIMTIENVSPNFAHEITLTLKNGHGRKIASMMHHRGQQDFFPSHVIGTCKSGEKMSFVLHISPELYESSDYLDFIATSKNLENKLNTQNLRLRLSKSVNSWDFEFRT